MNFFILLDIVLFPFCFLVCFFILRARANRCSSERVRLLYYRAFYFKVICVLAFTLITAFYFKGGDTTLYYFGIQDMRNAISDDPNNFWTAMTSSKLTEESPLFPFFYYDNNPYDITYNYMISTHNFTVPKVGLLPSYLFGNSYLCLNMCFGFFALGGAIRLFKAFYYFYPHLYRELAVACLFLPGVAFWSASLLKDPITFGCIGIIIYALVQMIFIKKNYTASILWIIFCGYLLFTIKIYILLVLALSLLVWFFAEFNKLIKDRTLRYIFTVMTFAGSALVGFFLLNYLTSLEAAQEYKLDTLLSSAESQREGYEFINQNILQNDSHFKINASNPVSLVLESIVATFFRPFIWEINTPIALLSAFESAVFLAVTLFFMFKKGVKQFFSVAFSDGRILMCFVFAFVFAFAVGSATANFGALSRYKIPCTPFYMLLLLLLYDKVKLPLPQWFNKIINFAVPKK
ncbi:MAG: hypothetical protein SGI83_00320 [Bacteroidota bacterium]|nr:hypothetical protein [Bacteroidota bacterium]